MLRQSPYPNVAVDCVECDDDSRAGCSCCKGTGEVPSAMEYAIHNYELDVIKISEYEPLESVCDLAKAVEEHGQAFAAWWNNESRDEADTDAFQDAVGFFVFE